MSVAIVTGSGGLIGSEAVEFFTELGLEVVGLDNDMRRVFFGEEASTRWNIQRLRAKLGPRYIHLDLDIRHREEVFRVFERYGKSVVLVIHTAAQPSHDWAARDPFTDFEVNALGTLNVLEATRQYAPEAVFIFTSTNKVYGDTPNRLPLLELETRYELDPAHPYYQGIREDMSIDQSLHSLFGASEGSSRCVGSRVWPVLRDVYRHFPGRDFDGTPPFRRSASRISGLCNALCDDPDPLYHFWLQRQAGAGCHS